MLITKHSLQFVSQFAGEKDARYMVNGVLVENGNQNTIKEPSRKRGVIATYSNLRAYYLTPERRARTCGYFYLVENDHRAHTAFDTREGLAKYLNERGLSLEEPLEKPGGTRIIGSYRTESLLTDNPRDIEEMYGFHTRTLSNGDYVIAVIRIDDDGIRTVHTLNPNVKNRHVFDHKESNILMGGNHTSQL